MLFPYSKEAWSTVGLTPPDGAYEDLIACYSESQRAYHTLQHLHKCFQHYETAQALCERPGDALLAIWLHDAVYDPRSTANEEASAELAAAMLATAGAPADLSDRMRQLILATRHAAAPASPDSPPTQSVSRNTSARSVGNTIGLPTIYIVRGGAGYCRISPPDPPFTIRPFFSSGSRSGRAAISPGRWRGSLLESIAGSE